MGKSTALRREKQRINNKYIEYILLALISAFIIAIPFYRGLYFRENYISAVTFVSLLYSANIAYKFIHKEYKVFDTYIDVSVLLIPMAYLVSFFFGVNTKDGFDSVLIYTSYFMIFKIASDISKKDRKARKTLINVVIISTFIVGIACILCIAKLIFLKGVVMNSRLYGPFQYSNATASVLAVGIVLTINMLLVSNDLKIKAIYGIIATTLIPVFVFTLSRGGYLALAAILLVNFLLIDGKSKLLYISNSLAYLLSSATFIYKYFIDGQTEMANAMLYYSASLVISMALTYLLNMAQLKYFNKISEKKANITLIIIIFVLIGSAAYIFSSKEQVEINIGHSLAEDSSWKYEALYIDEIEKESQYTFEYSAMSSSQNPNSYGITIISYDVNNEATEIYREFSSIGQDLESKQAKFTTLAGTQKIGFLLYNYESGSNTVYKNLFLKDSYGNVVKKYERLKYIPKALADRIMDINLDTESSFLRIQFTKDGLQILKDYPLLGAGGGAWKNLYRKYQSFGYNSIEMHNFFMQYAVEVGILGFIPLAALLICIANGLLKCIKKSSDYLPIYLAVLVILLHSSIDFNLSMPAVAYMLWLLIGMINTDESIRQIALPQKKSIPLVLLVISIFVAFSTSSIKYGINTGEKAARLLNVDMGKTEKLYEKAISADKYNSVYRVDYAQIMASKFKNTNDMKYLNIMKQQIDIVRKYEPYNYRYITMLINALISNGKLDEAVAMADDKLKNEPMVGQSYAINIDLNYEIAKYFFENDQHEKAIPYLKNMIKVKEQYDKRNSKVIKPIALPEGFDMKTDLALNWIEQANKIKK